MVEEIKGKDNAAFYAGLLISAFALAEACTAMFWGQVSDHYGRKPIILVALAGTALSSLMFGFAKNYWVALTARIVGGLLNGNVAVMQTMVAEMVRKPEHEPAAYAMQPFMWSLGSVAGSALGGFAAKPAVYYPGWFSKGGVFGQFPYLLPNLIAAAVIAVALIQGYFLLKETNAAVIERPSGVAHRSAANIDETTPLRPESDSDGVSRKSRRRGSSFLAAKVPIAIEPSFDLRQPSSASALTQTIFKDDSSALEDEHVLVEDESIVDSEQRPNSSKAFTKEVIGWTVGLVLICFHQMGFFNLLAVYLQDQPRQPPGHLDLIGGLGEPLPQVGTYLAVNSIVSVFIQGMVFPIFVKTLGVRQSVRLLTIFCPVIYVAMPFISLMATPGIGVYAAMILQSFITIIVYPCLLIMLKNATPSTQVLGKVNGLAMSACSGARTVAPPLIGIVYSLIGSAGAWWACGLVAVVAVVELLTVPQSQRGENELLRRASVAFDES